jgi:hypothetical protein
VLTLFPGQTSRLFVAASLVTRSRLIAALLARKLMNEANRVRFELKYRDGE